MLFLVSMTETVPESLLATYRPLFEGLYFKDIGEPPTSISLISVLLLPVSITETVFEPSFAT